MANHNVIVDRKKDNKTGFITNNIKNYIMHSTPRELLFDIATPVALSFILIFLLYTIMPSARDLLNSIHNINNTVITIIAILAGFNSASLAIIAASSKLINTKLFDTKEVNSVKETFMQKIKTLLFNNPSYKELEAIVSFFAYAVICQLLILIISLFINVTLTSITQVKFEILNLDKNIEIIILCIISGFWFTLVFHSIFLSIRNIDMIAHFIKFSSNED
ncbi:hypothetical protein [Ureibacillus sp. FSL E2-3493]|uniref:hypothetical protein n=1 Tax=Ureibacillus sp. FSL E2-3493 TaxID=2921367 RepID=UPI00311A173A